VPPGLVERLGPLRHLGAARVRGRLLDLGPYPGALLDDTARGEIAGDLLQIDSARVLAALDRYEGFDPDAPGESLYRRTRATARRADGSACPCEIYVYGRDPGGAPAVADGDWAAHLARRGAFASDHGGAFASDHGGGLASDCGGAGRPGAAYTALAGLWALAGGPADALAHVRLAGDDPVLPSSFRVGAAAGATIAAAGLAAAELWRMRTGRMQQVHVALRHAAVEFRSERHLRVEGRSAPALWDPLAGLYRTGDGRFVRLHTNFPQHRGGILALLRCGPARADVAAALLGWEGARFETSAAQAGLVASLMRSPGEWTEHPQAQALAVLPVLEITRIGDAPPRPLPLGPRPLCGLRVLDLTRILAGPVAGRILAAHGADVMRVAAPHLPSIEWLVIDTGRGKRSAYVDLDTTQGREILAGLLSHADVFLQAYRPNALARRGFSAERAAALRPGLVTVSLSAYGRLGPWAERRGFDSIVQAATGFEHAEGQAEGISGPKPLPVQALDHASGAIMAFGAIMARLRQAQEGGSWHVQVSLAQTGRWLWGLGRVADGLSCPDIGPEEVNALLETSDSAFGRLHALRHAAELSETPARWDRPAVALGTHPPRWTARGEDATR